MLLQLLPRMWHVPPRDTHVVCVAVYILFYSLICSDINKQLRSTKKQFIEKEPKLCSSCDGFKNSLSATKFRRKLRNFRVILMRKVLHLFNQLFSGLCWRAESKRKQKI